MISEKSRISHLAQMGLWPGRISFDSLPVMTPVQNAFAASGQYNRPYINLWVNPIDFIVQSNHYREAYIMVSGDHGSF